MNSYRQFWTSLSIYVIALLVIALAGLGAAFVWCVMSDRWPFAALSGALLVIAVFVSVQSLAAPDRIKSISTEQTLRTASTTLAFIRDGLTPAGCRAVCELLWHETRAEAVAITDREHVLAYVGVLEPEFPPGSPVRTQATKDVLAGGTTQTFSSITPAQMQDLNEMDTAERLREVSFMPAGIVCPLRVRGETVGVIKFYYSNYRDIDRTERAVSQGFAELLSTQLALSELDRQSRLATEAEVRALQAQINPHFLFNTINTISALIRTDPVRARGLLREFARFYRQTLENSDSLIPLSRELEQTRRYLIFEYARFGKDRISEQEEVAEGLGDVAVPAFIIQPIVENAVRHAMREEGMLHIDVYATTEGDDLLISIADDGVGMTAAELERLQEKWDESPVREVDDPSAGTGTALRNVRERIIKQYAQGSGVDIVSRPDEGTVITLRLNGALRMPRIESAS